MVFTEPQICHVQDVVDANMRVLEEDVNFEAFNVGSGKSTTILEYANLVRSKLSAAVSFNIPGEYRRGDNRHSVSSVDKLERLDWRPRRDLSQILDDFLNWIDSIGGVSDRLPDAYEDMKKAGVVLNADAAVQV